jgi:hypothetical protein
VTIFRASLWVVGVILAGLVAAFSFVIGNQVRNPVAAQSIGILRTGAADANLAYATFATRKQSNPKAAISDAELQLARQGYRSEPLSVAGLGLIIVATPDRSATRAQLLALGGKLTRRNSLITSASIEAAARRDDARTFFTWMSRAVLTDASLRSIYIGAMAEATARSGAVDALAPVIGPRPAWSEFYWRSVVSRPNSLVNAAKLRVAIAKAPWRQTAVTPADKALASGLIQAREFDAALGLATGLGQASSSDHASTNLLANANFARQPQLPPIDWQLATSGNLGASINPKGKALTISVIAGAYGYAARQLLQLSPGSYELGWSLTSQAPIDAGALTARLSCAEKMAASAGDASPAVILSTGTHRAQVVVPPGACRWYWLSFDVSISDTSPGFDAQLRDLTLRSTGAVSAKPSVSAS